MTAVVPSTTTPQPNWRSACSMTRVSSESSRSRTVVCPSHSAASSSTRLEMLLEPGRRTVPDTTRNAGTSRNSVSNTDEHHAPQRAPGDTRQLARAWLARLIRRSRSSAWPLAMSFCRSASAC